MSRADYDADILAMFQLTLSTFLDILEDGVPSEYKLIQMAEILDRARVATLQELQKSEGADD